MTKFCESCGDVEIENAEEYCHSCQNRDNINNGLCIQCDTPLDSDDDLYCQKCKENLREKICPECGDIIDDSDGEDYCKDCRNNCEV